MQTNPKFKGKKHLAAVSEYGKLAIACDFDQNNSEKKLLFIWEFRDGIPTSLLPT